MRPHNYCASFKARATKHTQEKGRQLGRIMCQLRPKNERIHLATNERGSLNERGLAFRRDPALPRLGGCYTSQWHSQAGGYLSVALLFTNSYWSPRPVLKDQKLSKDHRACVPTVPSSRQWPHTQCLQVTNQLKAGGTSSATLALLVLIDCIFVVWTAVIVS